ncbi:MAG: hypothetical protein JO023_03615 [Chloroflexi bacterium]|nr:hypothetical protein [Chloroflexota bacterium]
MEPENSDATFSATYARLFGDDPEWPTAQFRTTYQGHPFDGLYGYMQALVKAYYPLRDVVVEDVNYSGVARDRQRLQDLRALQVALWRYHDLHGRFPCAAENVWQWSSSGASWISDDPAACGYTDVEPLSTAIGAPLPADPLGSQHAGVPFWAPTDSYTYGYLSCPNSYGQFFVLGMRLEVLYLDVPQHQIVDCSGNTVQWPPEVVGLTALDPLDGESQPRPLPPVASPAALARDAQRKADLQQVRDQLLAYRERYGRFPCPGVGQWQFSSAGPQWIADLSPDCGASPPGSLGALPVDPVNQPGAFWAGALGYGYRAYGAECPEWMRGQYFVLGARLENSSDPDLAERPRDCTNVVIPWPADVYALTSDDQSAAVTPGLVPDQHDGALVRPPAAADARR